MFHIHNFNRIILLISTFLILTGGFGFLNAPVRFFTPQTLTITMDGNGTGTISGQGIDCGSDCTERLTRGNSVTLTATPDAGSGFGGWSIGCEGGNITIDVNVTCTATFNAEPPPAIQYGTFANPFASDSLWNTKITAGATREALNLSPLTASARYLHEKIGIRQLVTTDPTKTIFLKTGGTVCGSSDGVTTTIKYKAELPNTYLVNGKVDNNIYVLYWPDGNGSEAAGTLWDGFLFQRCTNGSNGAQRSNGGRHLISGDGVNFTSSTEGGRGGSGLSGMAGTIRSGEATTAAGTPIPHTLMLVMQDKHLHYDAASPTPGYQWPAYRPDGCAPTCYIGSNPNIVMGALLTVGASSTEQSLGLKTEYGKKIFHALQDYGGIIGDGGNFDAMRWSAEIADNNTFTVDDELETTYNIIWNSSTQATLDFKDDVDAIWADLNVVTNNSEINPKGP